MCSSDLYSLTLESLKRAEAAEAAVEALGFFDFRVRCKGDAAIVEMNELQYARALEEFGRIAEVLRRFFVTITLSDKPRKPSV